MAPSEKPPDRTPPSDPKARQSVPRVMRTTQVSLSPGRLAHVAAEVLLGPDRPARLQMIAALVLGLLLVAIPLYLWRRPRSEPVTVASEVADASRPAASGALGASSAPNNALASDTVLLSEARVLECHDPGSKHTPQAECDHLASIEKSLAQAIQSAPTCVPSAAGGGTLVYVIDVSFQRKRSPIALMLPKDGRELHNPHAEAAAATSCSAAVKHALSAVPLEGIPHAHARYKIAMTATYAAQTSK